MFDPRVMRVPAVVGGATAIFLVYLTFSGAFYLLPQYLQYVEGRSVLAVDLAMAPFGVCFGLVSRFSTRVTAHLGLRHTMPAGLLLMAAGLVILSAIGDTNSYLVVLVGAVVYSVGIGIVLAPATAAVMNALPLSKAGEGSSVNQLARQLGGAFGVAVIGSVYAFVYAWRVRDAFGAAPDPGIQGAERSLGSAISLSRGLAEPAGRELVSRATSAFDTGPQVALLVAAGLAVVGAAIVHRTVGTGPVRADPGP